MNILTFDIEEWYLKKNCNLFREYDYKDFDRYLEMILNLLDECRVNATFFCLGGMARDYPEVVRRIADRGHEIGCHSDRHIWLDRLSKEELRADTERAVKSLEDVCGKPVVSFRAPSFSISEKNSWAFGQLAGCGITRDASVFPTGRDFGGFGSFPSDVPVTVEAGSLSLKEFPVGTTTLFSRRVAYSGGGYFRLFPKPFLTWKIRRADYVMCYFHIGDLMYHEMRIMDRDRFEAYFDIPGTLTNRTVRMVKRSLGTRGAFEKMCALVRSFDFISLDEADRCYDWEKAGKLEM